MFPPRHTLAILGLSFLGLSFLVFAAVGCGQSAPSSEPVEVPTKVSTKALTEVSSAIATEQSQDEDSRPGPSPAPQPASTPAAQRPAGAYRTLSISPTVAPVVTVDPQPATVEKMGVVDGDAPKEVDASEELASVAEPQRASSEPAAESSQLESQQAPQPAAISPAGQAPQPPVIPSSRGSGPMALPATAGRGGLTGQSQPGATTFLDNRRIPAVATHEDAVSTFSLDVDRTSYRLALNWAGHGYDVEPASVRAEEWINSFNYSYSPPHRNSEFAIHTDVYRHPLDKNKHMARIAFQAPHLRADPGPLNITLVLDASGSMGDGNRVAIVQAAAEAIRQGLRDQDRIAVVQFTDDVIGRLTVEHTRPSDRAVHRSINRRQPNGSTNVQAGLNLGVELADAARRLRPDAHNYVILMSDGVANVDATNPFAILESAGDRQEFNPIRLVTIGVGIANYNDYLLEQLAQHGNGWYRYLDDVHQARQTFSQENWLRLAVPFADQTRAQVTWDSSRVRSWRIVGYENRVTPDEYFTQNRKEFAEIPSGAATTVFYELELASEGYQRPGSAARLGDIELRWVVPESGRSREQYAALNGPWPQGLDDVNDPYLKLGSIVALAADRYSALPHPAYMDYGSINWELSILNTQLGKLRGDLGYLTAFNDFCFLLDYMIRHFPAEPSRPAASGYSP